MRLRDLRQSLLRELGAPRKIFAKRGAEFRGMGLPELREVPQRGCQSCNLQLSLDVIGVSISSVCVPDSALCEMDPGVFDCVWGCSRAEHLLSCVSQPQELRTRISASFSTSSAFPGGWCHTPRALSLWCAGLQERTQISLLLRAL